MNDLSTFDDDYCHGLNLFEELSSNFQNVKNKGFVKNLFPQNKDGGAGNTFETLMGIRENNRDIADWNGWELKTKKDLSSTMITLFTKTPTSKNKDAYLADLYGVPDKDYPSIKRFETRVCADKWLSYYGNVELKLEIDEKKKRIYLLSRHININNVDKSICWTFEDIKKCLKKIENIVVIDFKTKDGKKFFHYDFAQIYSSFKGLGGFLELLKEGVVVYENRVGVYHSGKNAGKRHNHGGAFRINPKKIGNLYDYVEEL